jgi:transposase
MPHRPFHRNQNWLLPPDTDSLLPADHPARFVAAFVEALGPDDWRELEIARESHPLGVPAYHPELLLCVWLYGFMSGVRSSRKLEAACRDQIPYLWLTGWQHPDHNTLWRFYQAHREAMRKLFKRTVRTAMDMELVDWVVQAVDGTKIAGNAAKARTYSQASLQAVLERTEAAIADLEAQNTTGGDPVPPRLPETLAEKRALQKRLEEALKTVSAEDGPSHQNLTDPDAQLMKAPQGFICGYNAQAMVSALDPMTAGRTGLLITAAEVTTSPADQSQLLPMIHQAEANTGRAPQLTLADGGYHSGPNLAACAAQHSPVAMPESHRPSHREQRPYDKEAFRYDAETDSYQCPQGQTLHFAKEKLAKGQPVARIYRGSPAICRACPAFGQCTTNRHHGRTLQIGPNESALQAHRVWMATPQAKTAYRQRKQLPEPTFGILKELHGARRFLLRGLANVRAEWTLLATAFNLRTLARVWACRLSHQQPWSFAGIAA